MKRKLELTIDFNIKRYDTIRVKQMDTTEFVFKIICGGLNIDITNCTPRIIFTKPDDTIVIQSSQISIDNNIITTTLLEDCLRLNGKAKMELEITDTSNNIVSSFYINLEIEATSKGKIESSNTPNYIEQMESTVQDLETRGNATINRINEDYEEIVGDVHRIVENYDNILENVDQEVQELISTINQFNVIVVSELPTSNIDTHAIYFVPMSQSQTQNAYKEYIYVNNNWEFIGSTEVNLSPATTTQDGLMSKEDKQKLDNTLEFEVIEEFESFEE